MDIPGIGRMMGLKQRKREGRIAYSDEDTRNQFQLKRYHIVLATITPIVLFAALIITSRLILAEQDSQHEPVKITTEPTEHPPIFTKLPREIAEKFIAAQTPEDRLKLARNPEKTALHMKDYSEQALSTQASQLINLGVKSSGDLVFTEFVATFPKATDGSRSLCVVATPEGPRVDWDAYAAHQSASWEDILSGQVQSARVRVIIEKSNYYNYAYNDESKWISYRMIDPRLNTSLYAYAQIGSLAERALNNLSTKRTSHRVILDISSSGKVATHKQFAINTLISNNWVSPE